MIKKLIISNKLDYNINNNDKTYLYHWHQKNFNFLNIDTDLEKDYYHWDNKNKVDRDLVYINELYNRVLINLQKNLNTLHNKNKSIIFWKIILGPWLRCFLEAVLDRYENINFYLNKNSSIVELEVYDNNFDLLFPKSVESMYKYYLNNDQWGYDMNIKIFKYLQHKNVLLKSVNNSRVIDSIKNFISSDEVDFFYQKKIKKFNVYKNQKYCILKNTFNFKTEIYLNLLLGQIPILSLPPLKLDSKIFDKAFRENLIIDFETINKFEIFLKKIIKLQIPSTFIENFDYQCFYANNCSLPKDPKIIISTSHLYSNTLLMFYTAIKKEEKRTKLIGIQHGSEYGILKNVYGDEHEPQISDTFFTWGHIHKGNPRVEPIGISRSIKNYENIDYKKNKKILLFIRTGNPYFRLSSSLFGYRNFIKYMKDVNNIPNLLDDVIKKNLIIRLYTTSYENTWKQAENFKINYPTLELDGQTKPLKKLVKQSKLIIYSYFSTGFYETMTANFPVVMLMDDKAHLLNLDFKIFYEELFNQKIIFKSTKELCRHINKNYLDIENWWLDEKTQQARKNFVKNHSIKNTKFISTIIEKIKKK